MKKTSTSLSSKQRKVMKILKPGGIIYLMPRKGYKYRLLDAVKNPVSYVHGRTVKALINKELISKQTDGSITAIAKI